MSTHRINLWSSPRNISTALMYSFAQRPDTRVVDEPLYAHYLRHQPTAADHPGRDQILSSQENDGERVIAQILNGPYPSDAVVFKQMTHHLVAIDTDFLSAMKNVLLIRDPRAILASFSKVVDEVTAEDIGLPQQHALYQRLQASDALHAVVDSRRLLLDPAGQLRALCEALDLPFYEAMLQWEAGPRPEDGVWATHWYGNVHRSTGFLPYREKTYTLSPQLERIAEDVAPLYQHLLQAAL